MIRQTVHLWPNWIHFVVDFEKSPVFNHSRFDFIPMNRFFTIANLILLPWFMAMDDLVLFPLWYLSIVNLIFWNVVFYDHLTNRKLPLYYSIIFNRNNLSESVVVNNIDKIKKVNHLQYRLVNFYFQTAWSWNGSQFVKIKTYVYNTYN